MRKPWHGTTGGYSNHKCRCRSCRKAWNQYFNRRRYERELAPDDPRHGKYTTYGNYRCRCEPCTAAWAAFYAGNRRRRAEAAEAS